MFGYIKPYIPDLRVREHEMYKALYCGLCRTMGHRTGCISRLTLSYDFVFLAAVRTVLEKDKMCPALCRCIAHPMKKRSCIRDNPALTYSAAVAALLTVAKVRDDISDSKGLKKLGAKILLPSAKSFEKKALKENSLVPLNKQINDSLKKLSELEAEKCPSTDMAADTFGELLSDVFSWGLSENEARIAKEIGLSAGKYIYIADAADDREKDMKSGNYNPLNISPLSPENLKCALRLELYKMAGAVELMDFTGKPELEGIIKNIVYEGLPKTAENLFEKNIGKGEKNE